MGQYVVKSESKNSFCYLLETKLKRLGDMHGATAYKFGIYFGKEKSDPALKFRWRPRWGDNKTTAFENVKAAIGRLLEAGKTNDIGAIKANGLSPMFKGKILATYFPNKFLNVFAREHLEHFLDKLGIPYGESQNEVDERELLMGFKNADSVMSSWTTYEFAEFLYHALGRPLKKRPAQRELNEYIEDAKEYPKLSEVNSQVIALEIHPSQTSTTEPNAAAQRPANDFEREEKIHRRLGVRGEEIVERSERDRLHKAGREDLARKVRRISIETDSAGYDIASFEDDGRERPIEVKATARSPEGNPTFIISSNQWQKARQLNNYYIYVVFEAKTTRPKIWRIKNPQQYENDGLALEPVNFRVTINTAPRSPS